MGHLFLETARFARTRCPYAPFWRTRATSEPYQEKEKGKCECVCPDAGNSSPDFLPLSPSKYVPVGIRAGIPRWQREEEGWLVAWVHIR